MKKRVSLSQNGIDRLDLEISSHRRNVGVGHLRLSKSEDSLCDVQRGKFEQNVPHPYEKSDASDSEDDYFSDNGDVTRVSDDESSKSSYSITTEANCDFDFYQAKDEKHLGGFTSSHAHETFDYLTTNSYPVDSQTDAPILQTFKPRMIPRISTGKDNITVVSMEHVDQIKAVKLDVNRNFRITRSNSKRSLENFRAFVDDNFDSHRDVIHPNHTQRSYSYVDLDDTVKYNDNNNKFESTWSGLDLSYGNEIIGKKQVNPISGSVPDLKKIFISDYL